MSSQQHQPRVKRPWHDRGQQARAGHLLHAELSELGRRGGGRQRALPLDRHELALAALRPVDDRNLPAWAQHPGFGLPHASPRRDRRVESVPIQLPARTHMMRSGTREVYSCNAL